MALTANIFALVAFSWHSVGFDDPNVRVRLELRGSAVQVSVRNGTRGTIALVRGVGHYVKVYDARGRLLTHALPKPPVFAYYRHPIDKDWKVLRSGEMTRWVESVTWLSADDRKRAATILLVRNPGVQIGNPPELVRAAKATRYLLPKVVATKIQ